MTTLSTPNTYTKDATEMPTGQGLQLANQYAKRIAARYTKQPYHHSYLVARFKVSTLRQMHLDMENGKEITIN